MTDAGNHRMPTPTFNRTYGVEIECILPSNVTRATLARDITAAGIPCREEALNHSVPSMWKTTTDGSIGYGNAEIVSPPLLGDAGFREIDVLCGVLAQRNVRINTSCGLHVHIGAQRPRPLDLAALKRLALLYVENESYLDAVQPPSRRGNSSTYCQGVATVNPDMIARCTDLNQLLTVLYYKRMPHRTERFGSGHGDARRYTKINMVPFLPKGTIEFRQHAGTVSAEKIRNWVLLCQAMIETALTEGSITAQTVATIQAISRRVRAGTKNERLYNTLLRDGGATLAELLDATRDESNPEGWKALNVPRVAAQYGLTLTLGRGRDPHTGRRVTRYFGAVAPAPVAAVTTDAAPIAPRAKPTNIGEFIEYIGLTEVERAYYVGRSLMFAQQTLNLMQPE